MKLPWVFVVVKVGVVFAEVIFGILDKPPQLLGFYASLRNRGEGWGGRERGIIEMYSRPVIKSSSNGVCFPKKGRRN